VHRLLVERAIDAGVIFQWSTRVTKIDSRQVTAGNMQFPYTWLVARMDRIQLSENGEAGPVRTRADGSLSPAFSRADVPNFVDVYWGQGCQMLATPTAAHEVCVSVLSRDAGFRNQRGVAAVSGACRATSRRDAR